MQKKAVTAVIKYETVVLTQRDVVKCSVDAIRSVTWTFCGRSWKPHYQCWPVSWSPCDGWRTSCKLSGRWLSPGRTASSLKQIAGQSERSVHSHLRLSRCRFENIWLELFFPAACSHLFLYFILRPVCFSPGAFDSSLSYFYNHWWRFKYQLQRNDLISLREATQTGHADVCTI